mmetsp:Transcript_20108/g.28319  ORF Transcript_20108/g.28319 Transcript_20108/m.28319 type:complete len:88 (+) Transcript_20108:1403-1666(+)
MILFELRKKQVACMRICCKSGIAFVVDLMLEGGCGFEVVERKYELLWLVESYGVVVVVVEDSKVRVILISQTGHAQNRVSTVLEKKA